MDYKEFLRILDNKITGRPVIFEPFLTHDFVQQIVWRCGSHVWDTPTATAQTLISCNKHIGLDTTFIDATHYSCDDMDSVLSCAKETLPDTMKLVVFCDDRDIITTAQNSDYVCSVAVKNPCYIDMLSKHSIYITPPDADVNYNILTAIQKGFNGVYISSNTLPIIPIEDIYDEYNNKIAILGGVGVEFFNNNKPLPVYNRCRTLFSHTNNKGFALGTGACHNSDYNISYLGLISMFGFYKSQL